MNNISEDLNEAINIIETPLAVVSINDQIIKINAAFKKLFGYSENETLNKDIKSLLQIMNYNNNLRDKIIPLNKKTSFPIHKKYIFLHKNGSQIWAQTTISRFRCSFQVSNYLVQFQDISEIKKYHEALAQKSKLSELGQMAGGIAHEINNPLAVIQTTSDWITTAIDLNKTPSYSKIKEKIILIKDTVKRISTIIEGLNIYSRDSNKLPQENVCLKEVLDMTLGLCQDKFKNNRININTDIDQNIFIFCNKIQLSQVFLNLLNNSYDAIKDQRYPWIKITAEQKENNGIIHFQDSGLGISDKISDEIMKPLFSTKPVHMGTGLGLSIAKNIIEMHGGVLFLNRDHTNTTFTIKLPSSFQKENKIA